MRLLWLFCLIGAPLAASASDCLPLRVGNPEGNFIRDLGRLLPRAKMPAGGS